MKFAVLGSGMVGQAIAGKLDELGHDVTIGTRDPDTTRARREPTPMGMPGFGTWLEEHQQVRVATFAQAASDAEIVVLAVSGAIARDVLASAGAEAVEGKIVIDITNPLDFSQGMPPTLSICNTDSVGEQLQQAFPTARIVKTLNTVNADLMVDPQQLQDGDHTIFVSGNDAEAKSVVTGILTDGFGWQHVLDLGDITTARGTEMYLPMWLRLWGSLGTPTLNVKVISQPVCA